MGIFKKLSKFFDNLDSKTSKKTEEEKNNYPEQIFKERPQINLLESQTQFEEITEDLLLEDNNIQEEDFSDSYETYEDPIYEGNETVDQIQEEKPRIFMYNQFNDIDIRKYLTDKKATNPEYFEDVLLLNYCNKKDIGVHYPERFFDFYHIRTPIKLHQSYIDNGFLESPDQKGLLDSLTVEKLKNILRENSLKVSGRKAELIERIITQLSEEEVNNYTKDLPRIYTLTEKGKKMLEDNSGIIWLDRSYYFNITGQDYRNVLKIIGDDSNFGEVINYIVKFSIENDSDNSYGIKMGLIDFYIRNAEYSKALYFVLDLIYYEIFIFLDRNSDIFELDLKNGISYYYDHLVPNNKTLINNFHSLKEFLTPEHLKEVCKFYFADDLDKKEFSIYISDMIHGHNITYSRILEVHKYLRT